MKKSDYPCKCSKCGELFENLAAFVEHNKACGSFGYDIVPGAVKVSKVDKAIKGTPKKVEVDSLRDELPKEGVKVIDAAPKKTTVVKKTRGGKK